MSHEQAPAVHLPEYEAPTLTEVGSVHELTLHGHDWPCIWNKTLGPPDYVSWIPITACSS